MDRWHTGRQSFRTSIHPHDSRGSVTEGSHVNNEVNEKLDFWRTHRLSQTPELNAGQEEDYYRSFQFLKDSEAVLRSLEAAPPNQSERDTPIRSTSTKGNAHSLTLTDSSGPSISNFPLPPAAANSFQQYLTHDIHSQRQSASIGSHATVQKPTPDLHHPGAALDTWNHLGSSRSGDRQSESTVKVFLDKAFTMTAPIAQPQAGKEQTNKQPTPPRAIFQDLPSAYTSITARSNNTRRDVYSDSDGNKASEMRPAGHLEDTSKSCTSSNSSLHEGADADYAFDSSCKEASPNKSENPQAWNEKLSYVLNCKNASRNVAIKDNQSYEAPSNDSAGLQKGNLVGVVGPPPSGALPRGPPSYFQRPSFLAYRDLSINSDSFSRSSIMNTRNLLGLSSQKLSSFNNDDDWRQSDEVQPVSVNDTLANPSRGKELGQMKPGNLSASDCQKSSSTRNSSRLSSGKISIFAIDKSSGSHSTSEHEPSQELQMEISQDLRHFSQVSGLSEMSGSLFVLREDSKWQFSDTNDEGKPTRPSGSHTSFSCKSGLVSSSYDSNEEDHKIDYNPLGMNPTGSTPRSGLSEDQCGDDDADWETEPGSRVFSAYGRGSGLSADRLESNGASISPRFFLPPDRVIRHPADQRFDHVYRVRTTTPDGVPALLPTYSFTEESSFPNRNAWTTPMPSPSSLDRRYQHPTPLAKEHTHPFSSSPPIIGTPEKVDRGYDDLHGNHHTPKLSQPDVADYDEMAKQDDCGESFSFQACSAAGDDDPYCSDTWVSIFDDTGSQLDTSISLPKMNGSFSNASPLGPRGNLTGTPGGTGMREVGSSLANGSSPGMEWSSSVQSHARPPMAYCPVERKLFPYECSEVDSTSRTLASDQLYGPPGWSKSRLSTHRMQLVDDGLLPRSFGRHARGTPLQPVRESRSISLLSVSQYSEDGSSQCSSSSDFPDYPSRHSVEAFSPTQLYNPKRRSAVVWPGACLYRFPRPESSIVATTSKRKRNLSRLVLGLCFLFPPLLLLYGYGLMDAVIVQISRGEIEHFANAEKRFALWIGWTAAAAAAAGIVAAMIVIGLAR
ncbi:MAG: hypothetical protein M1819_000761 [Sarea resinae]|nr:MAG: hypothetical protein M1819_000761 [Sarea resinae]